MRIPHYLHRARSAVWHYRRRMPRVLFPLLQKTEIKKALGTRELGPARELALHLWRAYEELHTFMRALGMAGKSSSADIIARLKREGRHYRLGAKTPRHDTPPSTESSSLTTWLSRYHRLRASLQVEGFFPSKRPRQTRSPARMFSGS